MSTSKLDKNIKGKENYEIISLIINQNQFNPVFKCFEGQASIFSSVCFFLGGAARGGCLNTVEIEEISVALHLSQQLPIYGIYLLYNLLCNLLCHCFSLCSLCLPLVFFILGDLSLLCSPASSPGNMEDPDPSSEVSFISSFLFQSSVVEILEHFTQIPLSSLDMPSV